jgi:hypothetical protein
LTFTTNSCKDTIPSNTPIFYAIIDSLILIHINTGFPTIWSSGTNSDYLQNCDDYHPSSSNNFVWRYMFYYLAIQSDFIANYFQIILSPVFFFVISYKFYKMVKKQCLSPQFCLFCGMYMGPKLSWFHLLICGNMLCSTSLAMILFTAVIPGTF